jgi:hypothetical protein
MFTFPTFGLITKNNNTPEGLEKDKLKSTIVRFLAQEGKTQELVSFLTGQNTPEDIKILIPTHIENGECAQARALLNTMDIGQEENKQFFKLYDVLTTLCETERGKTEINPIEREIIKNVKESETYVSVNAESMLVELDKQTKLRKPERMISVQEFNIQKSENKQFKKDKTMLNVYPNPSEDGNVIFTIDNDNIGKLIVSDLLGKLYEAKELNKNTYTISNLPRGVYVVQCLSDLGVNERIQLIVK